MTFTPGTYRVAALSIRLLLTPDHNAKLDDQALLGEEVEVLEGAKEDSEFVQVRSVFSGNVGWVPSPEQKLVRIENENLLPTHRVTLPRAVTFRLPDPETETMVILPMNAQFLLGDRELCGKDEFARVLGLPGDMEAWVRTSALMPVGTYEPDFVTVQERFENTPYVWGARDSTLGFDCSRLLAEGLRAAGWKQCPGDTKDQVHSDVLGEGIGFPRRGILKRGDLIFWKGHVGTMIDQKRIIHATDIKPYHRVVIQELAEVIGQRLSAEKGNVTQMRRLSGYPRK